jgi:hypothetical protein
MSLRTYLFTITSLSLLFISCKKNNPEDRGHHHLVKTVSKLGDSASYTFFNYDEQNRLIRITDSNNTNHTRHYTSLVYDANDKWIKSVYTNDFDLFTGEDSFLYDNNRIIKKQYSNSFGTHNKNIYVYDVAGNLIHDTTYSYWSNSVFGFANYSYNNSGNIVSWQEYYDQGGTMQSDGTSSASYNNLINPYYDFGLPFYISRNDNTLMSKYQVTQGRYSDGSIANYTYDYYPEGLVKKIVITYISGGYIDISTVEFFYD